MATAVRRCLFRRRRLEFGHRQTSLPLLVGWLVGCEFTNSGSISGGGSPRGCYTLRYCCCCCMHTKTQQNGYKTASSFYFRKFCFASSFIFFLLILHVTTKLENYTPGCNATLLLHAPIHRKLHALEILHNLIFFFFAFLQQTSKTQFFFLLLQVEKMLTLILLHSNIPP